MWWKEIMSPKEYNLYVAFRCWVQFGRCNKIVGVLWRIVYIEWYMNNLQYELNAKCVRQPFTAGRSLPPGFHAARECFDAARECFGAKKLLSRMFVSSSFNEIV